MTGKVVRAALGVLVVVCAAGCSTGSGPAHPAAQPASSGKGPAVVGGAARQRPWVVPTLPMDCSRQNLDIQQITPVPGPVQGAAVVIVRCGDLMGSPPSSAFLLTRSSSTAKPVVAQRLLSDDEQAIAVHVTSNAEQVVLRAQTWSADAPRCCPDRWLVRGFRWLGQRLVPSARQSGPAGSSPA